MHKIVHTNIHRQRKLSYSLIYSLVMCNPLWHLFFQQHGRRPKYQIHLNSQNGPICVLLVNHDTSSDTPVVVPVPPVEQAAPPQQQQSLTTQTITDVKMEDVSTTTQKKPTELIKEETIEERLESMLYSGICLNQTPLGQKKVSALQRCLLYRECTQNLL